MKDNTDICNSIFAELSDIEKNLYPIDIIEHIVLLYDELIADYDRNIFDKVAHIDLYFIKGFDNYIDISVAYKYINLELEKDKIIASEDFILKIISFIRKYNNLNPY